MFMLVYPCEVFILPRNFYKGRKPRLTDTTLRGVLFSTGNSQNNGIIHIMKITKTNIETWLDQHGGRVLSDMEIDERGYFVYMWSGINHIYYPYYLPNALQ